MGSADFNVTVGSAEVQLSPKSIDLQLSISSSNFPHKNAGVLQKHLLQKCLHFILVSIADGEIFHLMVHRLDKLRIALGGKVFRRI